jgi:hypothetical protein
LRGRRPRAVRRQGRRYFKMSPHRIYPPETLRCEGAGRDARRNKSSSDAW